MTQMWARMEDDAFDPFHDLIEEFETKCQDLATKPGYELEEINLYRDSSAGLHKLTVEWSSPDPAQLLLLQVKGLEFSLSAYLGKLGENQASFAWGFLASQLPEVFLSEYTTPFDLKIMDHNCAPPRLTFDFGGAASVERLDKKVFTEMGRGHWAHLMGLRHRATLDMSKYTALDLVLNTWMGFVHAIRENALLQKKLF